MMSLTSFEILLNLKINGWVAIFDADTRKCCSNTQCQILVWRWRKNLSNLFQISTTEQLRFILPNLSEGGDTLRVLFCVCAYVLCFLNMYCISYHLQTNSSALALEYKLLMLYFIWENPRPSFTYLLQSWCVKSAQWQAGLVPSR